MHCSAERGAAAMAYCLSNAVSLA